jgi:hypothetical protein
MPVVIKQSAVPIWYKEKVIDSSVGEGRARPIKHYRKRSCIANEKKSGNSSIGMPMDIPGGSSVSEDTEACKNLSIKLNVDDDCAVKECKDGYDVKRTSEKKYYAATTKLNKNYYTDSRAYLRSRCKTFDQNAKIRNVGGDKYKSTSCYDVKSDDDTLIHTCSDKTVAYKPQGAVSSSSRLLSLKEKIFESDNKYKYDPKASARYPSDTYSFRTKQTPCTSHRRNGKMAMCF